MKRTRRIAAALGLLALPLFTGAWTLPQAQQQETEPSYAETEIANEDFDYRSITPYGTDVNASKTETKTMAATYMRYSFVTVQAGANETDRIDYELKVTLGPSCAVKIKYMSFWGNNNIVHGDENLIGPFSVTSSGCSGTLWCDHGGVPTGIDTSNQRWNCNFMVVSMQIKANSGLWYESFLLNFYDGADDTFYTAGYSDNKQYYIDMLSSWGAW